MQIQILLTLLCITLISIVQSAIIKGSYIVKLKGENSDTLAKHIKAVETLFGKSSSENEIKTQFKALGPMYHAKFTDDVVKKVRLMPEVEYVETDKKVKGSTTQKYAPWNLARVSHRGKIQSPLTYDYDGDGSGVAVYVLDSGIFTQHQDFKRRARVGATFISNNDDDELGHGTHVAGIIGSDSHGLAKKAELVSVKVLDKMNGGSVSGVIAGIEWSIIDKKGKKGNVINMSLGTEKSQDLNDAVKAAIGKGFIVVTAAGNDNLDACFTSPASEPRAITVAATDSSDARAKFSNWGRCVTIFAPGADIMSTTKNGKLGMNSGTSMAAPHIAGLAACFLSIKSESHDAIKKKIIKLASENVVTNPGSNSFNRLIYNGIV